VLVVHGFKGFQRWGFFPELAQRLARAGIAAVTFDLSGSGIGPDGETFTDDEAFARNTYTRELEDIDRVREHVRSGAYPWIDARRAGILGHSRGGGMALIHAAEHGDYRAVVTWAAIGLVDAWSDAQRALWRRQGFTTVHNARTGRDHRLDVTLLEDVERNRARLDIAAACTRLDSPTLLVHGTADEAVPLEALERLARAFRPGHAQTLVLPGAGHTFGARHPLAGIPAELERVLTATVDWFAEHLGP
jgi:dipeptidyl aminopeptidase/acylaminoacyl peptidase